MFKPGTVVKLRSGSEGWVRGEVVDTYDITTYGPLGAITGAGHPGYIVRMLEGKHRGEKVRVPENYVVADAPADRRSGRDVLMTRWHGRDVRR